MADLLTKRLVVNLALDTSRDTVDEPRRWQHVLLALAQRLGTASPSGFRPADVLDPRAVFVFWEPTVQALTVAAARRPMVYLCWGMPAARGHALTRRIKQERLRSLLRMARVVAVNDDVTGAEVQALSGRPPVHIPFLVDTDFFAYAPLAERGPQVLVPGDNDRDEALVRAFAQHGVPVVRVTREPRVVDYHRERGSIAGLDVRTNVPFHELRTLYQTARAVLLPIRTSNHAAGQTSLLEAIAAGAPILISEGRVAGIGASYPLQYICADSALQTWMAALSGIPDRVSEEAARESALRVAREHHPDVVVSALLSLLQQRSGAAGLRDQIA